MEGDRRAVCGLRFTVKMKIEMRSQKGKYRKKTPFYSYKKTA